MGAVLRQRGDQIRGPQPGCGRSSVWPCCHPGHGAPVFRRVSGQARGPQAPVAWAGTWWKQHRMRNIWELRAAAEKGAGVHFPGQAQSLKPQTAESSCVAWGWAIGGHPAGLRESLAVPGKAEARRQSSGPRGPPPPGLSEQRRPPAAGARGPAGGAAPAAPQPG